MLPHQIDKINQEQLIEDLQKHRLNAIIGNNLLNNPKAMYEDVLSSAATPFLLLLIIGLILKGYAEETAS